jgi:hypothetical protein
MTDLHVEGTPEEAVATLFGACRGLSESASSISSAELADLDTTELIELRQAVAAVARTADDGFGDWCTRTDKLIVAELYLRAYAQAAIDANAAVIIDEERRLACAAR